MRAQEAGFHPLDSPSGLSLNTSTFPSLKPEAVNTSSSGALNASRRIWRYMLGSGAQPCHELFAANLTVEARDETLPALTVSTCATGARKTPPGMCEKTRTSHGAFRKPAFWKVKFCFNNNTAPCETRGRGVEERDGSPKPEG